MDILATDDDILFLGIDDVGPRPVLYFLTLPLITKGWYIVTINGSGIILWSYGGLGHYCFVICQGPVGKVVVAMLCSSKQYSILLQNASKIILYIIVVKCSQNM